MYFQLQKSLCLNTTTKSKFCCAKYDEDDTRNEVDCNIDTPTLSVFQDMCVNTTTHGTICISGVLGTLSLQTNMPSWAYDD